MAAAGATRELEQRLKSQNLLQLVEKHRCGESQDALLGRFLLARSSDVEKAFEFLKADLEWRESMNVRKYQGVTSSQLLAVNGSLAGKAMLDGMLPVMYLGRDKQNRPIMYRKFGSGLDAPKLIKETGFDYDKYCDYNIWILEMMVKNMSGQGQWVSITDFGDLAFKHITKMHLSWAKVLASLMTDHYPERLGKSMMINCPTIFNMAWAIAKTWLDDRIKAKIGLYGAEKTWRPEIEKIMDLDLLPASLGGKAEMRMEPHSLDFLAQSQAASAPMDCDDAEAGAPASESETN